jgi:hypothetical protein
MSLSIVTAKHETMDTSAGQCQEQPGDCAFLSVLAGMMRAMTEQAATATAVCATCDAEYDAAEPRALKLHTEPKDCNCGRCRGKPECYMCGSSFCMCPWH